MEPNYFLKIISSELKTLEWNIFNPDRLIWRLITRGEQILFNLEIKKKSGSSFNPDIHHSKVPSFGSFPNILKLKALILRTPTKV